MSTDTKLDQGGGTWILAEAAVLTTTAADVVVDSAARRGAAGGPFRRALVHGVGDALVLNYAAGDVSIAGRLHLRDPQHSPHSEVTDVQQLPASHTSLADDARRRLDRLEDRLTSLTAFIGAAEIPGWTTAPRSRKATTWASSTPRRPYSAWRSTTSRCSAGALVRPRGGRSISPPPGTLVTRGSTVVVTMLADRPPVGRARRRRA